MASVGLLYVGGVLFLNGLMLLGRVEARSAAPLNIFVGGLQVVTPTYLIFTANGDADVILGASGLYLFGFTYLYVAFNLLAGLDGTGLGYFSLFVAVCALVYAGLNFFRLSDSGFGVIWLNWAFLWLLFFLVLGLGLDGLSRYTGAVATFQGVATGIIPAFMLLTGKWVGNHNTYAIALAIVAVALYVAFYPRFKASLTPAPRATETSTAPAASPQTN